MWVQQFYVYVRSLWGVLWRTGFGKGPYNGRHTCTDGIHMRRNTYVYIIRTSTFSGNHTDELSVAS